MHSLIRILALAIGCGTISMAHGQSSYMIRNRVGFIDFDVPVYDSNGQPLAGPGFRAELYGGSSPDSLAPVAELNAWVGSGSAVRVQMSFEAGGYFGRSEAKYGVVLTVRPLEEAWLQVRAWDVRVGGTYEEAVSRGLGGYGESPLFRTAGGDPVFSLVDPKPLVGLQSFRLLPVIPEPSTWALLALGGLAVAWQLRRRLSG